MNAGCEDKQKCIVCDDEMHIKIKLKANIFQCPSCGLQIADIRSRTGAILHNQDEAERERALYGLRMSNYDIIIRNLPTLLHQNSISGLEVGCAHGWFLEAVEKSHSNIDCTGIEPQKEYYCIAKSKFGKDAKLINGFFPQDIPKGAEKFDFIIFNDVFEHIPNTDEVLNACYAQLTQNGILILNLPLAQGFIYKMSNFLYRAIRKKQYLERLWQLDYVSPHLYYFNKGNLARLLRKKGLELVKYHRVDVFSKGSINSRIKLGGGGISKFSIFCINILLPLFKYFPEDCGCFYFQKQ